jgi:hypothetical protein
MESSILMLRKLGDWAFGRDMPAPQERRPAPEPVAAEPLPRTVKADSFSMQQVERFFAMRDAPPGNALVSEIVDENGPLPGREQSGGRRRTHGVAAHFSDDTDRAVLFAPNDAPDELQQEPTELQALLRQQEGRDRRRYTV